MSDEWRDIAAFANYQVSDSGDVRNLKTERILKPSHTQMGHLKVNLVQDGVTYTKGINHLVARAFLKPPNRADFISVIHLDGDKANCHHTNLLWRPRYFAIQYHLQFGTYHFEKKTQPVFEPDTGWTYPTAQDVVTTHGLLLTDLLTAIHVGTYVWPTYQIFKWQS
jgi:NUMOD4 motif